MFGDISAPLSELTHKGKPQKVVWGEDCERAFTKIKASLADAPMHSNPCFRVPFIIQTDASERELRAVLTQMDDSGRDHPVVYLGQKLLPREQAFSTLEKECRAIV